MRQASRRRGGANMQRALLIGTLLLVAVSVGNAEDEKEYALVGAGTFDCAHFANMYRGDPTFAENMFFNWAQGFMSGLNAAQIDANGNSVNLNSMTTEEQQSAIRSYCNAHPLAPYIHAIMDLYQRFPPNKPVTSTGAK